ncbi:MAG: hypothetical protein PHT40_04845 [Patescibacteria group bacterium]|nr:hypothetical protein [Patescibacteria group bacterium]
MTNKLLYIIIVLLVLIIIGGGVFFFTKKSADENGAPTAENTTEANLSEQPNQAKFNEYFTNAFIAKLPVGAEFNPRKIIKTNVLAAGEQFCTSMDMKKQIPASTLSSAIYDVNAKQDTQSRGGAFPQALGPGNSIGCEPLSVPAGKYEYKIYLNDDLVINLPFEVK